MVWLVVVEEISAGRRAVTQSDIFRIEGTRLQVDKKARVGGIVPEDKTYGRESIESLTRHKRFVVYGALNERLWNRDQANTRKLDLQGEAEGKLVAGAAGC